MNQHLQVAVEASAAFGEQTGVGTYVKELLTALSSKIQLNVFLSSLKGQSPAWLTHLQARVTRHYWPAKALLLGWRHLRHPRLLDRDFPQAAVVHSLNYSVIPTKKPLVVTLHDLYFLRNPGAGASWGGQFFAQDLKRHHSKVQQFIAVSALTRRDAIELLGIAEEKITVIPEAPRSDFTTPNNPAEDAALRSSLGLPSEYFLYFGNDDPRKNRNGLIHAHAVARSVPVLVVVGGSPVQAQNIIWKSYLPSRLMQATLNGAFGLLFPSFYEGFGLPAIEAFTQNIPVAATPTGILAELPGCFLALDPNNPAQMANAFETLAQDTKLRKRLIESAAAQAQSFSWSRAAKETAQVYQAASEC